MNKNIQKTTYHHGDLRKSLLDASFLLLEKEGYQSLSLRKIAKLAGVSQSAPYRHFVDLEALYAEVALEGFQLMSGKLNQIRNRYKKHPLLQFRESGVGYVEFALKNPDLFQIMYGNQIQDHSKYKTLIHFEEGTFQILRDIITDCKLHGFIKVDDVEKASTSAWAMVHGIAVLLLGKQVMLRNLNLKNAKSIAKEMIECLYVGLR